MTDRERWTVYPLIFLTLGIALKDKLVEAVDLQCRNLFCNAVVVIDQKGKEQALLASDAEGGLVRTRGTKNGLTLVLGNTDEVGGLMSIDPQGRISVNPGSIFRASPAGPQPGAAGQPSAPEDRR
jgi:hypothetical protein